MSGRRPAETQPERTGLAWQRTALGVVAVAGIIGHGAFVDGTPLLLVLAGVVGLLGLALLGAVAPVRYRQLLRAIAVGAPAAAPRLIALAAGTVVLAALAAAGAVLTYS